MTSLPQGEREGVVQHRIAHHVQDCYPDGLVLSYEEEDTYVI
jgi:hypothetical protein